jgi:16S rRNA (cytidine1402-2'-O)-methyltransferase
LVRRAAAAGIHVSPIPGASAVVAALSAAGLPTDAFLFLGFAPRKAGKRTALITSLAHESRTVVFYESPKRIVSLIAAIGRHLGDRHVVLAREMTKIHEEFLRGTPEELLRRLASRPPVKGECTLLVAGAPPQAVSEASIAEAVTRQLQQPGMRLVDAVRNVSTRLGVPRNRVYAEAVKIKRGRIAQNHQNGTIVER